MVDDDTLTLLITAALPQRQREFAVWAAVEALTGGRLIAEPTIAEAVTACVQGTVGALPAGATKLARIIEAAATRATEEDPAGDERATRTAWRFQHAMVALAAACDPDPQRAAADAAAAAQLAWPECADQFRQRARDYLACAMTNGSRRSRERSDRDTYA